MGKELREHQVDIILENSILNAEKPFPILNIFIYNAYRDQAEVLLILPIPVQIRKTGVVERRVEWESRKKG